MHPSRAPLPSRVEAARRGAVGEVRLHGTSTREGRTRAGALALAQKLVGVEYCAEQCAAWNPWAGGSEFYVGLESGVGVPDARPDYAEVRRRLRLKFRGHLGPVLD